MTSIRLVHTLPYLVAAVALGAVIGFERQWWRRLAGLRTDALAALGAGSFVAKAEAQQEMAERLLRGCDRADVCLDYRWTSSTETT